jgi:hypothetical protein
VVVQSSLSTPTLVRWNRRASPRLIVDQLPWLERVRLTDGTAVSLIDLSIHGALFEVDCRLRPGEATPFELIAGDDRAVVTGRVLRTEVSALGPIGARYRGACTFDQPLPWRGRLSTPTPPLVIPVLQPGDDQPWPGWSEVRIAFRHGRRLQGYTRGFHSSMSVLDLWPSRSVSEGDRQMVPLALVRQVVFAGDFDDAGQPQSPSYPGGRLVHPVEVTFRNNDVVRGATPGYDPDQIGFWIVPLHSPETRVFALSAAVREICFF